MAHRDRPPYPKAAGIRPAPASKSSTPPAGAGWGTVTMWLFLIVTVREWERSISLSIWAILRSPYFELEPDQNHLQIEAIGAWRGCRKRLEKQATG